MRKELLLSVFTISMLLILAPMCLDQLDAESAQGVEGQNMSSDRDTDHPSTAFIIGVVILIGMLVIVEIYLDKNKSC